MDKVFRLNRIAQQYEDQGDYETAEYLFGQALKLKEISLGPSHPNLGSDLYNLGLVNLALDNHDRAEELLMRALVIQKRDKGRAHPDVLETVNAIAEVQCKQGSQLRVNSIA